MTDGDLLNDLLFAGVDNGNGVGFPVGNEETQTVVGDCQMRWGATRRS